MSKEGKKITVIGFRDMGRTVFPHSKPLKGEELKSLNEFTSKIVNPKLRKPMTKLTSEEYLKNTNQLKDFERSVELKDIGSIYSVMNDFATECEKNELQEYKEGELKKFAEQVKEFVFDVMPNCMMGEEEKDIILNKCDEIITNNKPNK